MGKNSRVFVLRLMLFLIQSRILGMSKDIVAQKEASSGIALSLHPVVILHISDHWTRIRQTTNQPNPRVIGGLLGKQNGRNVEIMMAYELLFKAEKEVVEIDQKFLNEKTEHSKKENENFSIKKTVPLSYFEFI